MTHCCRRALILPPASASARHWTPARRDALTGVVTINAAAATDAFTAASAHLRGNYRVQILTLAGLAAYVDSDGVAAGIAFDAADSIDVDPSRTTLLQLLDKSLEAGIKPEAIAELANIGVEVARSMGSTSTPNRKAARDAALTQLERVGAAP